MGNDHSPWLGKTVGGRYRLESLLGRGGMGEVYVATQLDLGRKVAFKLLLDRAQGDDHETAVALQRLELEARSAAGLGHPNIVQVTDFAPPRGDEPAYMVMELLHGRPLDALIRQEGPLSLSRTVIIAQQVLSALSMTHQAGIVHRDLKPENIFLVSIAGGVDVVKLLDFGLAKLTQRAADQGSLTQTGAVVGTVRYMSPEQFAKKQLDGRTDLFSLGVVLYYSLTGVQPFAGDSLAQIIAGILHLPTPPIQQHRPDLPAEFVLALEQALAKDREQRYPDADAMAAALAPWAVQSTTGPQPRISGSGSLDIAGQSGAALPPWAKSEGPDDDPGVRSGRTTMLETGDDPPDQADSADPTAPFCERNTATLQPEQTPHSGGMARPEPATDANELTDQRQVATAQVEQVASAVFKATVLDAPDPPAADHDRFGTSSTSMASGQSLPRAEPGRGRRWGLLLAGALVLLVGGLGASLALVLRDRTADQRAGHRTATAPVQPPDGQTAVPKPPPPAVPDAAITPDRASPLPDVARPADLPLPDQPPRVDRSRRRTAVLRPAARTGRLMVLARPKGSPTGTARAWSNQPPDVWLDGKNVGRAFRLLPNLPPGEHTITIKHRNHWPERRTVRIQAGRTTRVTVVLEPKNIRSL